MLRAAGVAALSLALAGCVPVGRIRTDDGSRECTSCRPADDPVTLRDRDGFRFETGPEEAQRLHVDPAPPASPGPVTFDAGGGSTGVTGSGNVQPRRP